MDMSAAYDNTSAIAQTPTQSPGISISGNAPPQQQAAPIQQAPAPAQQQKPPAQNINLSDWEPVTQAKTAAQPQQSPQQGGIDMSEWEPVQPPQKTLGSIASGVGDKLMGRLGEQGADQEKFANNQISGEELALNTVGKTVAGSINDIIGGVLESAAHEAPESAKKIAEAAGNAILNTDIGKAGVAAIQQGGQAYQDFARENPRTARSLEALVNIGGIVLGGVGTKSGAEAAAQGVKSTADTVGKVAVDTAANEYAQHTPEELADIAKNSIKATDVTANPTKSEAFNSDKLSEIPAFERKGFTPAPTMDSKIKDYEYKNADMIEPAADGEKWFGPAKETAPAEDKTIEALKPEPEAPTPTPAATDTPKPAEEAPTGPLDANSKALKRESSVYYDKVAQSKEQLPTSFSAKVLDGLRTSGEGDATNAVKAADDPVNQLMDRYEKAGLRDHNMTMGSVKNIDEALGDIISNNLKDDGTPTSVGKRAMDAQDKLRELADAQPGGQDLQNARLMYKQGSKLRDLERMQEKAALTKNPATSIQAQLRTYLTSKRGRALDPEERNLLTKAAKDGVVGGALHIMGNRLIPAAAGIAEGLSGGITGGMATAAISGVGGSMARAGATAIKTGKLNKAKNLIAKKASAGIINGVK